MKKILVKGYFKGNLGDDLFVKILADRYPEARFEMFAEKQYSAQFADFNNVNIIILNLFSRFIRKILILGPAFLFRGRYAATVEIGGSIFQQQTLDEPVDRTRVIQARKRPYFVIGSNFGPVLNEKFVHKYRSFFSDISGAVFRDKVSYNRFSELSNVSLAPDTVFNLGKQVNASKKEKMIVIAPISLDFKARADVSQLQYYRNAYEDKLAGFVRQCVSDGYKVEFVSFSDYEQDCLAIARIVKKLDEPTMESVGITAGNEINLKIDVLKKAKYMVGTRFHSMILGWIFGVKQLVLSYSNKITSVISDDFPDQYSANIKEFISDDFSIQLSQMNGIEQGTLSKIVERSEEQFVFLDEFIWQ